MTATLSDIYNLDVTVNLAFSGTATNEADYTRSGASILIAAGASTGTITISAAQDMTDEADETVAIDIDSVNNATEQGTQQVTVTIVDDDPTPTVTLAVDKSSLTENGAQNPATVTATLSAVSGQTVTVNLVFSGAATVVGDYTRSGTSISIAAGASTGVIAIGAVQDSVYDPDETVIVDVDNVANGTEFGMQRVAIAIVDDEVGAPALATPADGAIGQPVPIALNWSAVAGATAYRLQVSTASNFATIIFDDATLTGISKAVSGLAYSTTYYWRVAAANANGAGAYSTARGFTTGVLPAVTLSVNQSSLAEDGSQNPTVVTVTLSAAHTDDVTVDLAFSGSATDVDDYTRSGTTITIAAGASTGSITVDASNDSVFEDDETVVVDIDSVVNATEAATQRVTIAIVDDDGASVGGFVWNDLDRDRVQDGGEPGVGGVEVRLYTADLNRELTRMDTNVGGYEFNNLPPANYYVEVVVPVGYAATVQDAGEDDSLDSDVESPGGTASHTVSTLLFSLASGEAKENIDAGLVTVPEIVVEGNSMAIADGDDSPSTADHTVFGTVYRGQPGPTRTFTVRNIGNAALNLGTPGLPTGYTLTEGLATVLAPGAHDTFTVELNTSAAGVHAGAIVVENSDADENPFTFAVTGTVLELAAVGNFVWHDLNGDGIQDAGEPGIAAIAIRLYRDNGDGTPATAGDTQIASILTAAEGHYNFAEIIPGAYYVVVEVPQGYKVSPMDQDGDDEVDSDVESPGGTASHIGTNSVITPLFSLAAGEAKENIDAGLIANIPSVAHGQSVALNERTFVDVVLSATNPDNDTVTYQIVAPPTRGTLTGTPPNLRYTPQTTFHGNDSFTFKVNDGFVDSAPATVTIDVLPVFEFTKPDGTEGTFPRNFEFTFEWIIRSTESFTFDLYLSNSANQLLGPYPLQLGLVNGIPTDTGATITNPNAPAGI